ncbi:glycosyltransferase [Sutcliffiella horikoshii]|uniref:Glycosyltransferase n=1 Tax=Sutcliffiella horikoshii TaxID=79883 RepID=A0AA94WUL7_9BACI|nr:glycosyltransferase [Sutcliffiella horikoshii]TYS60075.1 glycosyltransferase [Sutcliffiella horikoshii]
MKKILITCFDMEVGGVERSLINLLENFDYTKYSVDLMLFRHKGDFMDLIPKKVNLLNEIPQYSTFRKSIREMIRDKYFILSGTRIIAKCGSYINRKNKGLKEPGIYQMQLSWKYGIPFLPKLENEYDIAISYLWPHYFTADKINAKTKIAWIHTDYSTIDIDVNMDFEIWNRFDYIIAVSDSCKDSFLQKFKSLQDKVLVIENIASPELNRALSLANINNPMKMDKRFKIVTVARLSYQKGIDQAIEVMNKLRKKGFHNISWYVIGYGGEEKVLKDLIKKYQLEDCFFLLGKQTNPYPFMSCGDLYVQPSRYEGKAVTVTEAKTLFKPVLITNYPTASSQIIDGIDGFICPMGIEGLTNKIQELIESPDKLEKLRRNLEGVKTENSEEILKLYKLFDDKIEDGLFTKEVI